MQAEKVLDQGMTQTIGTISISGIIEGQIVKGGPVPTEMLGNCLDHVSI